MAETLYHEARGEPYEGKAAVATVVVNRVKTPVTYWENTVCGVVYQRGQFVWTEKYPRDVPHAHHEHDAWRRAILRSTMFVVADRFGIGFAPEGAEDSTFFSRGGFRNPKLKPDVVIGNHRFFSLSTI